MLLQTVLLVVAVSASYGYMDRSGYAFLDDLLARYQNENPAAAPLVMGRDQQQEALNFAARYGRPQHQLRSLNLDDLSPSMSVRDQEYLKHSSLLSNGHQYVQGGAGEGTQRLKPDGSIPNAQVIKTDALLPAYCAPPNPCPIGYTAADGCIEMAEFENSAPYSRAYQADQQCMCDAEHMFGCASSGSSGQASDEGGQDQEEQQLNTLARSIQNSALDEDGLEQVVNRLTGKEEDDGEHRVIAKKFFKTPVAASFDGEKLPVVAKKSPGF